MQEALQRLDREITVARQEKIGLLKLIHGYGSTGAGGDIRIAVQARLREMAEQGLIRSCIFGEDWTKSCTEVWQLLRVKPDLKKDSDLGKRNQGITVVVI
ncbi:MAG: hypothetical protein WA485_00225 [Candidatus Sulfotelmatobacter sp.]